MVVDMGGVVVDMAVVNHVERTLTTDLTMV